MMQTIKSMMLTILIGAFLLVSMTVYTVHEGHNALLLRLGKLERDDNDKPLVIKPGLHFKMPLLNQVRMLDKRLQTLDVQASRVPTKEQNFLVVDYYAKWVIKDPALFFIRTSGSRVRAEALLQQQINDDLRAEFSSRSLLEVISDERAKIMELLRTQAHESASSLGIGVVDVRIKQIELPETINNAVYERMAKKRGVLAEENRATGNAEAKKIRAQASAEAKIILANAAAEAARIRAEGVRKAAKIYSDAYSQDQEFFSFYQSLHNYKSVFDKRRDNFIVLDPNSQFFQYFTKTKQHA